MATLAHHDAAKLKMHILSEGISFDTALLEQFANDHSHMEKRRVCNDSDDRSLNRAQRIPQEMYLGEEVVVAVNYRRQSPWRLTYSDSVYHLIGPGGVDCEVTFSQRPRFFERVTPEGVQCDHVANLYGGSALAFFTPATCSFFDDGYECKFCSLRPNRSVRQFLTQSISPSLAASVLEIAWETDAPLLKQIMVVGGNSSDYTAGFLRYLEIARALDERQSALSVDRELETHISTMPPRDFALFAELERVHARITMNIEVYDKRLFEVICPGKTRRYGQRWLFQALERAASIVSGKRVHSTLIAGLEPVHSTIAGINYLASIGVTPIINVFHNDHGSQYEGHPRPSYEDLLEIAHALQEVYQEYGLIPYWKGCGRNALDFEAQQGWFVY